jgi:methylase of polypeptide subunit release factors
VDWANEDFLFLPPGFAGMEKLPEFYPDSDDTYLLIDSIEKDMVRQSLTDSTGVVSVEIGPGGGLVSRAFLELMQRLKVHVHHLMVDVNIKALHETISQTSHFGVCDYVNGDSFTWVHPDFRADIIFCNPPYVPSSPINRATDIRASYAGGELGREFIDVFLPLASRVLSDTGVFYFLLEKRNNPEEVLRNAREIHGLDSCLVMDRKIAGEHLFVYRLWRFFD